MKAIVLGFIFVLGSSAIADSQIQVLWDCHDFNFPDRAQLTIKKLDTTLAAELTAEVSEGKKLEQVFLVDDKSALEIIRLVDVETGGSKFLFKGKKHAVPPTMYIQAELNDGEIPHVFQASLYCKPQ